MLDLTIQLAPLRVSPWRAVEAQHQIATRKLVDGLAEHDVLEQLLESAKPPLPTVGSASEKAWQGLHYLLSTPFRYPPLRHGSRFGGRFERGIWYGALRISTVLAEVAYYRLRFLAASAADIGPVHADFTLFQCAVETHQGIDLSHPRHRILQPRLAHPSDYRYSQSIGQQMRGAGVLAFKFCSARDPRRGPNLGLFDPIVFKQKRPLDSAVWHSVSASHGVEFRHGIQRISRWFPRSGFLIDGQLPIPVEQ